MGKSPLGEGGGGGLAAPTIPGEAGEKITTSSRFIWFANKESWKAWLSNVLKDDEEIFGKNQKHARWLDDKRFQSSVWEYMRDVLAENAVLENHGADKIVVFKKDADLSLFSGANWNAFLMRNVINQSLSDLKTAKNITIDIVSSTVNFLLTFSKYTFWKQKILDAQKDIEKYANATRLCDYLNEMRKVKKSASYKHCLANKGTEVECFKIAPKVVGRFKFEKESKCFYGQIIYGNLNIDEKLRNKNISELPVGQFYCRYIKNTPDKYYIKHHTSERYVLDDQMNMLQKLEITSGANLGYDLSFLDKKVQTLSALNEKCVKNNELINSISDTVENIEEWGTIPYSITMLINKDLQALSVLPDSGRIKCFWSTNEAVLGELKKHIKHLESCNLTDTDEFKKLDLFLQNQENLTFEMLPKLKLEDGVGYYITQKVKEDIISEYEKLDNATTTLKRKFFNTSDVIIKSLKLLAGRYELSNVYFGDVERVESEDEYKYWKERGESYFIVADILLQQTNFDKKYENIKYIYDMISEKLKWQGGEWWKTIDKYFS
ncbi:MAG: hypothetical protein IJ599_03160 [Alphaproteobacteria bacterium]|nr:hypothetical protein [Alphaproteobacteria bacterium]